MPVPNLTQCSHVLQKKRRPVAVLNLQTMPSYENDPLFEVHALCVVCTARVVALLQGLEKGDALDL